jgi:flagellar hook-associated protein 1 FlgK
MSTSSSLHIAARALLAHRAVMDVIGQNIANVNTPGYTRRVAHLAGTFVEDLRFGSLGTGVELSHIERKRAIFLDGRFRAEQAAVGEHGTRTAYLESIEGTLGEPGESGVSAALDDFFAGWTELANDPSELARKQAVVDAGQRLASAIRRAHEGLDDDRRRADAELVGEVERVNRMLGEVADLNLRIAEVELGEQEAHGLRDQRDQLLSELSTLTEVRTSEGSDGMITVDIGGRTMVNGSSHRTFEVETELLDGEPFHVVRVGAHGDPFTFGTGKLGALEKLRDETIVGYVGSLDRLAASLIEEVNAIHIRGPHGLEFFQGTSAADIEVNPALTGDAGRVDASTTGNAGDNDLALLLGDLGLQSLTSLGDQSFSGFYGSFVAKIGGDTTTARFDLEARQASREQILGMKEQVEAVSLDEEMANMIQAEHAFEAAARLMTTASEMLETLVSMV